MQQFDYKRIEELYTTLSSIENSGDDVLVDIKKEINNEELILLKDEIMPYLAKYVAASLQHLKCQMDISIQYDGQGDLSYSFCKSGSNALIRGGVKPEDLVDFKSANFFVKRNVPEGNQHSTVVTNDRLCDGGRQKIKVVFPDGRVIQPDRVLEAIVEVVRYAGAERVQSLNIRVGGDNLVLKHPERRYKAACKPIGNGWLVNTYSSTPVKYEQILFISKQLSLGITAELISKSNKTNIHRDGTVSSTQLVLDTVVEYPSIPNQGLVKKVDEEVSNQELRIVDYSDKSFILYGDTSGYEKFLESQYGVYNKRLPEGAGWLFSKKREVVIRDFFKLHSPSINPNSESLDELLEQLSLMRTMKNDGIKSPHKAIYVMTLMEGIRNGRINYNKICLDDYLIQTFRNIWEKYVPTTTPYAMGIGNPFMHLSAEPFYFLRLKHEVPNFNIGWTVSAVRRVCDYAYVNDEFKRITSSDENYIKIVGHLVNVFGLKDTDNIEHISENISSRETGCVPKLPKPNIPNRYGAALFRLTYPSGVCEESDSYLDVYVKFIKYANPQRVRKLGIFSLGANIIATKEEINTRYEKQYKDVGDGYFFNTISTTQRKYEVMSYISKQLCLNVKVELVAKLDRTQ